MINEQLQQIGPYQIHTEQQQNHLTTCYHATDNRTDRNVIFHLLRPEFADHPEIIAQFIDRAKLVSELEDPSVMPILDYGECVADKLFSHLPSSDTTNADITAPLIPARGRRAFLVTPEIVGQRLTNILQQSTHRMNVNTVLLILGRVAAVLDRAHAQEIVHGQLAPDAIYINALNGEQLPQAPTTALQVVVDKFYAIPLPQAHITQTASIPVDDESNEDEPMVAPTVSTEAQGATTNVACRWPISSYMAPEQARNEVTITPQTDVYALGAIAYLLLLGRPPFSDSNTDSLLLQIANRIPTAPETIETTISPGLAFVLKSVLAKEASTRYGGAGEFVTALQQGKQWIAPPPTAPLQPVTVRPVPRSTTTASRQTKRRRGAWAIAALLLIIVAAIGSILSNSALRDTVRAQLASVNINLDISPTQLIISPTALSTSTAVTDTSTITVAPPVQQAFLLTATVATANADSTTTIMPITGTPIATTRTAMPEATTVASIGASIGANTGVPTGTITAMAVPVAVTPSTVATVRTMSETISALHSVVIDPLNLLDGELAPGELIVNGRAAPNAQLVVFLDGHEVGSTRVKATGTWSLILPTVDVGDHDLVAQILDDTNLIVARSNRKITIVDKQSSPNMMTTEVATEAAVETTSSSAALAIAARSATITTTAIVQTSTTVATDTVTPVPTATHTPLPTATHTPLPTNTPVPTATHTPLPTNTSLPTATHTPLPTNTPLPTATYTPLPTATHTPLPTNTPLPTATYTPLPTNTPLPTATHTPVPTDTLIPTATFSPVPTNTPHPTNTYTPIPTPTIAVGQVSLVEPNNGDSGGGQRTFYWHANFTPSEGYAFELVFWKPDSDPMASSFGLAAPTRQENVTADLDALDDILGSRLDNGQYQWGVLLVQVEPYQRIAYLGGGYNFLFNRSSSGGNGGGPPSSGE